MTQLIWIYLSLLDVSVMAFTRWFICWQTRCLWWKNSPHQHLHFFCLLVFAKPWSTTSQITKFGIFFLQRHKIRLHDHIMHLSLWAVIYLLTNYCLQTTCQNAKRCLRILKKRQSRKIYGHKLNSPLPPIKYGATDKKQRQEQFRGKHTFKIKNLSIFR